MTKQRNTSPPRWYQMDLHLHTPGSSDYQQSGVTYLDILQYAESKGLDIVAFTDHNTVRGYAAMLDEIEQLDYLVKLGRAIPAEKIRLEEYQRLLDKILVIPGFEFTATLGFHILCLFPPNTSVRYLEHVLMELNVPRDAIEQGLPLVGASSDVLTCYSVVKAHGGMAIAAHVNSTNGIANKMITYDEQTRTRYCQDKDLFAIEVTDWEKPFRSTANFFDGTMRGYPRRMHVIQGSDAHRMTAADPRSKVLGVGDRSTEILLQERSFEAIREVFEGDDFNRTRPYRLSSRNVNNIKAVRNEGNTQKQIFYVSIYDEDYELRDIVTDVCALANTDGGTIYIGLSEYPRDRVIGVRNAHDIIELILGEIRTRLWPMLAVHIETQLVYNENVVVVRIPHGDEIPYAVDDRKIYIRRNAQTILATRDDIVQLIVDHADGTVPTKLLALGEMADII